MERIYLLEDDDSIRKLVIYALGSQGYEAQGYDRPSDFWSAMEGPQPALILLDIMLPEEDGIQILQKLRQRKDTKKLPVIMLTAKGSEYDKVMGLESGADEVLQAVKKGVTADEMIEAGKKVRAAGMILSMTVISGLGGKKLWREHALGSARVISAIKPEYVGFLTLMIEPGTEMYDQYNRGEIELLTPHEVLDETELFIRSVDAEGTMFRSNHASNYIPLGGTLNGERDKILEQIEISRRKSKFRPDVFRGI